MPKGYDNPDFSGEKFGSLLLKRRVRTGSHGTYECECECGKVLVRRADYLIRERDGNLSCGCKSSCKLNIGPLAKVWKGRGTLPGQYLAAIRVSARNRGIDCDLSVDYLWELFESQRGQCALSGLEIRFPEGTTRNRTQAQTASLDRKDSSLGYVEGNVRWVHKVVNQMRNHFDEEIFLMVCNAVAATHPRDVDPAVIDSVPSTMNQHRRARKLQFDR